MSSWLSDLNSILILPVELVYSCIMAKKRDPASIPCPSLLMELGRPSLGPFPVAIRIPFGVASTQPYVMPFVFDDPSETASM